MMLITPKTYDNPSFVIGPVNNNRTAWRPFGLPAVLIVPFVNSLRSARGNVSRVRVYIEDVPQYALVAGHDHIGQRFPDKELYSVTLSGTDLVNKRIDVSAYTIYSGDTDDEIAIGDAAAKVDDIAEYRFDTFAFATATGIRFRLPYIPDAYYYDLSDVQLETESLPHGHYNLVYEATYHPRVMNVADRRELSCILAGTASARHKFHINHPGEVLAELARMTPQILLDGPKSTSQTIGLYRILADILNDVYDEYGLLRSLTWADSAPYELLPYLGAMLGWDLPYFPDSKDNLRRATLISIDQLQRLKGSKQALFDIFKLFGFDILLTPVWWSEDGVSLLRPNESDIKLQTITTTERMLYDYHDPGFGGLHIPLLNRPVSTVEVMFAEVQTGSDAEASIIDNDSLDSVSGLSGFVGYSKCTFDSLGKPILDIDTVDNPPVIEPGLKYDSKHNTVSVTFNGYKEFADTAVYAYAAYDHHEYVVPEALRYNRSNRFTLQILKPDGTEIPPDLLDFMIDFIYKVKAFHSLLDVLKINVTLSDVYLMNDFCIGGNIQQRSDTDAGKLQVPPAILPTATIDGDCDNLNPATLGYKASDLKMRSDMLSSLIIEYKAWLRYNGRTSDSGSHLVRENDGGTELEYSKYGQDRQPSGSSSVAGGFAQSPNVTSNSGDRGEAYPGYLDRDASRFGQYQFEYDDFTADPNENNDYCYKGRVSEELLYQLRNVNEELFLTQAKPHGIGTYWTYPANPKQFRKGVATPAIRSLTSKTIMSANAKTAYELTRSALSSGLTQPYDTKLSKGNTSYLGQLLRAYDTPQPVSLHFTDKNDVDFRQQHNLALVRPNLNIEIPYQHFPGCRFPTQYALKEDFTHDTWKAKPWDYVSSMVCGSFPCGGDFEYLNARLEVNTTDGDEYLIYDDVQFTAAGNGITPDILNNGEHVFDDVNFTSDDVVHSVYSGYDSREYDDFAGVVNVAEGTVSAVSNELFDTARDSGTSIIDYIDGYPAESGYYTAADDTISDLITEDVRIGLNLPDIFSGELAFKNISGILVDHGRRLSTTLRLTCRTDTFSHDIPTIEFIDSDSLEVESVLSSDETMCSTYVNDGSLANNLLLLDYVPRIKINYNRDVNKPFDVVVGVETISWSEAESVAGYQIQWSTDNINWIFANTFVQDVECSTVNGALFYRVRSMKYNKYSDWVYPL